MNTTIAVVMFLTFIITLIGTLAYAVRLVGVSTGKISVSFAMFNIMILLARTASTIQSPLLTKYVETSRGGPLLTDFYLIIVSAGIATIVGAILVPTFQRVFSRWVLKFSEERSVPKVILHSFSGSGVRQFKTCLKVPDLDNIRKLKLKDLPKRILIFNVIVVAIQTVATLAPIYAGTLAPELDATCITLVGVINGLATVLLYIYIFPYLSIKTDDVIDGKCSDVEFRRIIVGMVGSKVVGTFLALLLLLPASYFIVEVARMIP